MTFLVLETAAAHADSQDDSESGDEQQAQQEEIARQRAISNCAACDGSGLWRGIDGFVFVCQHCTFEMT